MIYYKIRQENPIFLFGHRGAPQIIRENTINSVCKAIELGCHGVEIDIQTTKDHQIILFHNDFISSNNKEKYFIKKIDYQNIIELCKEQNIPPPALFDDLIPIIHNNPNIVFNIEIKSHTINNSKILNYILHNIPKEILYHRCIISSFNYCLLYQLHFLFSYRGQIALILASKYLKRKLSLQTNKILISILNPAFLHINIKNISQSLVDWAHSRSMAINTYTVNDDSTLEKCISLGIDGIFTDNQDIYNK